MQASSAVLIARLRETFGGRRCVSGWLGYADVLFLGFGEEALPERDTDGQRVTPPFDLETNFADCRVEGPATAASAESDRSALEQATESLIGRRIESWDLLSGNGLRLTFEGGSVLTVAPWDSAEGLADAWCVKSPDGRILAVATDGRAALVKADLPVRDWFADPG